jgi:hypothetical protein
LNETIALGRVEPLHCPGRHHLTPRIVIVEIVPTKRALGEASFRSKTNGASTDA